MTAVLARLGVVLVVASMAAVEAGAGGDKAARKVIHDIEPGAPATYAYRCQHIRAASASKVLRESLAKEAGKADQVFRLAVDDRTNTVLVSGPPDTVARAKSTLAKIDAPARDQPPPALGPPILKMHAVPTGRAEAFAGLLQKVFAKEDVKIVAAGPDAILVWAQPEDQLTIARDIQGAAPPIATELITLTSLQAARVLDTLRAMFGKTPFLEADADRNAIVVRGTREQIDEVKAALRALGEAPPGAAGGPRIITVERGSAAALAEALQKMLPQVRPLSVRVILPGDKAPPPAKDGAAKKGKGPAEITISVMGNKLVVSGDDPQALALVQEMVRLVTAPGEGDFEVIRLKHAQAPAVAKVLDETFNGPRPSGVSKPGFASPKEPAARPERIRVVAEPLTNSILVRATALDLLTVRQLLTRLDVDHDTAPVTRNRILGPLKHAKAEEVAKILRELYRDKATVFTAAADPRTNSLVLRCSPALDQEIERLVAQLDVPQKP
jgi:type II secretory pathway component GspD/PulD (secretin)